MTNPYAPPQAVVQDVVDLNAGIVLADRGTRLGAALLDGIIFMALVYAPFLLAALAGGMAGQATDDGGGSAGFLEVGFGLTLIGLGVWLWFTIKYLRRNGQSIAKKAMGIKVVRTDGTPISLSRVIWLRNVLNTVIGIIPFYGIIDALFIFGESRRCLHDQIADTIVIKA
jgi:uncharacterized RDD family membrane protein YckC